MQLNSEQANPEIVIFDNGFFFSVAEFRKGDILSILQSLSVFLVIITNERLAVCQGKINE